VTDERATAQVGPTGLDATTPWVRRWLRAEGIAAFVAGAAAWLALGAPWPWFVILLLAPDISVAGYLRGPHAGAIAYNVAHNWAVGGLVLGLGLWMDVPGLALAGVLLVAHTGLDRALGYGLKYPTGFSDTHLGRIGRRR
jgi:Domain of unknown function (DUF4260)